MGVLSIRVAGQRDESGADRGDFRISRCSVTDEEFTTLLLEQFDLEHDPTSTIDFSRVCRRHELAHTAAELVGLEVRPLGMLKDLISRAHEGQQDSCNKLWVLVREVLLWHDLANRVPETVPVDLLLFNWLGKASVMALVACADLILSLVRDRGGACLRNFLIRTLASRLRFVFAFNF